MASENRFGESIDASPFFGMKEDPNREENDLKRLTNNI